MQKTKLGISVGLLGAAVYFFGFFGGSVATILIAAYILLMEENSWLKKSAVKAVALWIVFALISAVLGFIPDIIGFVDSIFNIFGGSFHISFLTNIVYMLRNGLDIVEKVLFLLLGLKALNQGTVPVPGIDKLVDKTFE